MDHVPSSSSTRSKTAAELFRQFVERGYTLPFEAPVPCPRIPRKREREYSAFDSIGGSVHIHPIKVGVEMIIRVSCAIEPAHVFPGYFEITRYRGSHDVLGERTFPVGTRAAVAIMYLVLNICQLVL